MKKFKLKIVTPERIIFEDEVVEVLLPTPKGQIGVLANHQPLITQLVAGEIIIKKSNQEEAPLVCSGGFVEVQPKQILVLADTAEKIEEIDIKRAEEEAKKRAEQLKEKKADQVEFAKIQASLEKQLARLRVTKKHHSRRQINLGKEE